MNYDQIITSSLLKLYVKEGINHRLEGPAVEWNDGYTEYWIDGKFFTHDDYDNEMQKTLPYKEYILAKLAGKF